MLIFPKIREFGELFEDSFSFFRENFKVLFIPYLLYVVLPAVLLIGLILYPLGFSLLSTNWNTLGQTPDISLLGTIGIGIVAFVGVAMLVSGLFQAFTNTAINLYINQIPISSDTLWQGMKELGGRVVSTFLLVFLLTIPVQTIATLLQLIPCLGIIISYIITFFWTVLSGLVYPIRFQEGLPFFDALSRANTLLKNYWWQSVGLIFVISLCVMTVQSIFTLPFMFAGGFGIVSQIESGNRPSDVLILSAIFAAFILLIVSSFLYLIPYVSTYLQYFNLRERKEGDLLEAQIDAL